MILKYTQNSINNSACTHQEAPGVFCILFHAMPLFSKSIILHILRHVACLPTVTGGFIAENPFRLVVGCHLGFLRRSIPCTSGRAQKSKEGGGGKEEVFPPLSPLPSPRSLCQPSTRPRPSPCTSGRAQKSRDGGGGKEEVFLPSPRSPPLAHFVNPSTRPRPSRANPRWRPHYEFRFFRPSNRLLGG